LMNSVPGCNVNTALMEGNMPENDAEPWSADWTDTSTVLTTLSWA
jgi:hypothetical protein